MSYCVWLSYLRTRRTQVIALHSLSSFLFICNWPGLPQWLSIWLSKDRRITLSCVVFQHLKWAPALQRLWALPLEWDWKSAALSTEHLWWSSTPAPTRLWEAREAWGSEAVPTACAFPGSSGFIYMWLKHSCLYPWKSESRHWVTQEATAGNVQGVGRYSAQWHLRRGLSVAFGSFHFLFKTFHIFFSQLFAYLVGDQ